MRTYTDSELYEVFIRWEADYRNGKTLSDEQARALSLEENAELSVKAFNAHLTEVQAANPAVSGYC